MSSDDDTETKRLEEDTTKILRDLEGAASMFANESIKNNKLRIGYTELIQKAAQEILRKARIRAAGVSRLTAVGIWTEAAASACNLRNEIMNQTRTNVNGIAADSFAKMLKEKGLTFLELINKYTLKLFGSTGSGTTPRSYAELELTEQYEVMGTIIEASGRSNPCVNTLSKGFSKLGYACILFTIAYSIYTICEAINPLLETVKTAVSLGFGFTGAHYSAQLGAAIVACGGPCGVIIGAIIGGLAGGFLAAFGGEQLVNMLYKAFFPSSATGLGPPPFDVIPVLGQPSLGCIPVIGPPNVGQGISRRDKPHLREKPVEGLPKLWPH